MVKNEIEESKKCTKKRDSWREKRDLNFSLSLPNSNYSLIEGNQTIVKETSTVLSFSFGLSLSGPSPTEGNRYAKTGSSVFTPLQC